MLSLQGIFPPITTPFRNEEISYNDLVINLKKWNETDLSGYVILGSNGENVLLSESERLHFIETAVKYIGSGKTVIMGAGQESTVQTIRFIKKASLAGGDAILLITPHYYKSQMRPQVIEKYYLEVAEISPLPILIYHVPKFTGLEIPLNAVATLGEHPNIIGMKDSSGNLTYQQSVLALGLSEFQLLTGTANTLMPSLLAGAAGGILALANFAPQICLDIYKYVKSGDISSARELQFQIIRANQLTTADYGIGGLKCAMDQVGLFGGEPRRPLTPPDKHGKKLILDELKKLNLL